MSISELKNRMDNTSKTEMLRLIKEQLRIDSHEFYGSTEYILVSVTLDTYYIQEKEYGVNKIRSQTLTIEELWQRLFMGSYSIQISKTCPRCGYYLEIEVNPKEQTRYLWCNPHMYKQINDQEFIELMEKYSLKSDH